MITKEAQSKLHISSYFFPFFLSIFFYLISYLDLCSKSLAFSSSLSMACFSMFICCFKISVSRFLWKENNKSFIRPYYLIYIYCHLFITIVFLFFFKNYKFKMPTLMINLEERSKHILYISFLKLSQFFKYGNKTCCQFEWLYRVAHKNRMAYFPQYVDAITSISVWGNFSWETWYQDQQFWFSSLFSKAHFVRQCRVPQFSLFSLN